MPCIRLAVALALLPLASGCGLIFGGTRQIVTVHSAPSGAAITTDPRTVTYTTPASLNLERNRNYLLTFSLDGYQPAEVEVQRFIRRGIVVLDIVLGVVPVVVDAATGAWYRLRPDQVSISLTPRESGPASREITLFISTSAAGLAATVLVESPAPGVQVTIRPR